MLHKDYACASFPQDKMARLYVGPFTVTKVISNVAYELDLPSSMRVNKVQNIRALKAASPDLTPEPAKTGPPEAPSARLQADPLEVQSMHIVALFSLIFPPPSLSLSALPHPNISRHHHHRGVLLLPYLQWRKAQVGQFLQGSSIQEIDPLALISTV